MNRPSNAEQTVMGSNRDIIHIYICVFVCVCACVCVCVCACARARAYKHTHAHTGDRGTLNQRNVFSLLFQHTKIIPLPVNTNENFNVTQLKDNEFQHIYHKTTPKNNNNRKPKLTHPTPTRGGLSHPWGGLSHHLRSMR